MTFPADHVGGEYQPEEHSEVSIAVVSIVMIGVALAALMIVF